MNTIKEIRLDKKLTQKQVADTIGISLRSYKMYENDERKVGSIKYNYILEKLTEMNRIDEEHGLLTIEEIKQICANVFEDYPVNYCILFGSYAKHLEQPSSDIDLFISTNLKGLRYYGLVEELRVKLRKKVDVLDLAQLDNNIELVDEILKDGIKIYCS